MKLEDQTCTYKQSKRLVELGVVLKTTWYWYTHNANQKPMHVDVSCFTQGEWKKYPAPNVAELGVLLPKEPLIEDYLCELVLDKFGDDCWDVGYRQIRTDGKYKKTYCLINEGWETEAQARADALIWLIENDFVKVEDLKL